MTSPISNKSDISLQVSEEKKKVSWGKNTVIATEPVYDIPEGCSKANEACLIRLLDARAELKQALSQHKSGAKKANVITVARDIISCTEEESDPCSRTINQTAHVLLARALYGMFFKAYLEEKEFIDADPEMKKKHDNWQQLLSAKSIFI